MGNTGPTDHVLEEQADSEAGPVGSCREPEWVVGAADVRLLEPTLRARSVTCSALPGSRTLLEQSNGRANRQNLRKQSILLKVSQNHRVSPKYHEKA